MKWKIFLIIFTCFLISCNKDDDGCRGVDCLPIATQTGAGTFGCLVNGEPFVDNSGRFNCFYQLVDNKYYFNISPTFKSKKLVELDLGSIGIDLEKIKKFSLNDFSSGEGGGAAFFISGEGRNISTNSNYTGNCIINKFDNENNIVSGTFEFQVFDEITQTLYTITEGRFDAKFTE
ncbi:MULTISPECIES: hypothetical protein [unclassified Leeuwenhoekiella]|uniref:hypothetical protein n=1 Tax=unclassified Leeuwenhoekiella TaxID=2615029 RepID=UPI000C52ABBD|nr:MULTISPECIES: hypothetical protein [unclassified Leeuwenhoekiella]MAW93718.1 hypothetical protein [Leeuwenhoekiella sp.]MBA83059.1 hypothetical protein [Leeuwenhoekiella sp.]|tara:strand:+ start:28636 stop:29163 length:528 start_codon:yes stop_codon:yes gene_type:complete